MPTELFFDAGERFEIRRELGAGGMGVVYEAFDRELGELVALKTLRHATGEWLARFKQEFRALHDVAHPNIVALGEFFDGASDPFFTMELVRGVSFLDHVRGLDEADVRASALASTERRGRTTRVYAAGVPHAESRLDVGSVEHAPPRGYDEPRLRAALRQLVLGVAALHVEGMVHRDIKPSNILVAPDGRVVLLDFGLVAGATAPHEADDGVVGTVAYMAPEQALSVNVTPAADWYSVGVVLFEALTGTLPHDGQTVFEIVRHKLRHEVPRPRHLVDSVPADLDELCVTMLRPQVRDRPTGQTILDTLGVRARAASAQIPGSALRGAREGVPFVGRATQLQRLHECHARSREAAVICLIEGVSGVGKSQLAEAFLAQVTKDDPDVVALTSRCYEREAVAYKAFDGIVVELGRYLTQLPPGRSWRR